MSFDVNLTSYVKTNLFIHVQTNVNRLSRHTLRHDSCIISNWRIIKGQYL